MGPPRSHPALCNIWLQRRSHGLLCFCHYNSSNRAKLSCPDLHLEPDIYSPAEPLRSEPLSAMTHTPLHQQGVHFHQRLALTQTVTNVLSFVWRARDSLCQKKKKVM